MSETTQDIDPQALMTEAGRRYWLDPVFSARVKFAVSIAEAGQPRDGFDRFDTQGLIAGACIALHLADQGLPVIPEATT